MELSDILEMREAGPRWAPFAEFADAYNNRAERRNYTAPALAGLEVLVRLPDIPGIKGLALAAGEDLRRAGAAAGAPQQDPGVVGRKISSFMVQGWRGLTGAHLKLLLAGAAAVVTIKVADDTEIPFQAGLLDILIAASVAFNDFLDWAWERQAAQDAAAEAADLGNSSPAPGTTPIPGPAPASGASGSRKSRK